MEKRQLLGVLGSRGETRPASEDAAMIATAPLAGLLELLVATPLALVAAIYGAEGVTALRQRSRGPKPR